MCDVKSFQYVGDVCAFRPKAGGCGSGNGEGSFWTKNPESACLAGYQLSDDCGRYIGCLLRSENAWLGRATWGQTSLTVALIRVCGEINSKSSPDAGKCELYILHCRAHQKSPAVLDAN